MNKLERAYSLELTAAQQRGDICAWYFEACKLRLAPKSFYTPDFLVVTSDGLEFHEVKGHWEDDAKRAVKSAAQLYKHFAFFGVRKIDSKWEYERFSAREGL